MSSRTQEAAQGKPLATGVDPTRSRLTQGFSGADLANVVNEATLLAARRGLREVSAAVLEEAVERAMLGVGQRRQVLSERERQITAYHEAGHALVGRALPGARMPHKVSIIARGKMGGYVWSVDEEERAVYSRSALLVRATMRFSSLPTTRIPQAGSA